MSADPADGRDHKLRFSAGRYEESLITLLIATQLSIGIAAVLAFAFWFLITPSDEGGLHLDILALALGFGLLAYLLKFLYGSE